MHAVSRCITVDAWHVSPSPDPATWPPNRQKEQRTIRLALMSFSLRRTVSAHIANARRQNARCWFRARGLMAEAVSINAQSAHSKREVQTALLHLACATVRARPSYLLSLHRCTSGLYILGVRKLNAQWLSSQCIGKDFAAWSLRS